MDPVQLACVKHAASVRPEPGSNPQIKLYTSRAIHYDLHGVNRFDV